MHVSKEMRPWMCATDCQVPLTVRLEVLELPQRQRPVNDLRQGRPS
jgi:hypothetical protein